MPREQRNLKIIPRLPPARPQTILVRDAGESANAYADSLITQKTGTATIADMATTEAVAFSTAFSDNDYAVAISTDGDEFVWVDSKTASGFTLTRSASSGARVVHWIAMPHRDP